MVGDNLERGTQTPNYEILNLPDPSQRVPTLCNPVPQCDFVMCSFTITDLHTGSWSCKKKLAVSNSFG